MTVRGQERACAVDVLLRMRMRNLMRMRTRNLDFRMTSYIYIYHNIYMMTWTRQHGSLNQWNGLMEDLCAGSFPYFEE